MKSLLLLYIVTTTRFSFISLKSCCGAPSLIIAKKNVSYVHIIQWLSHWLTPNFINQRGDRAMQQLKFFLWIRRSLWSACAYAVYLFVERLFITKCEYNPPLFSKLENLAQCARLIWNVLWIVMNIEEVYVLWVNENINWDITDFQNFCFAKFWALSM